MYQNKNRLIIFPGEVMNLQNVQKDWLQIDGRSLPAGVVIKYQDFTIKKEVGVDLLDKPEEFPATTSGFVDMLWITLQDHKCFQSPTDVHTNTAH